MLRMDLAIRSELCRAVGVSRRDILRLSRPRLRLPAISMSLADLRRRDPPPCLRRRR